MGSQSYSIPGAHGSTITFTVSGALSKAIAQAFATGLANAKGAGNLFVAKAPVIVQTNDIEVTAVHTKKAPGVLKITVTFGKDAGVPNGTNLPVTVTIPRGATPAQAATAIANAINAEIGKYNTAHPKRPITGNATATGNHIDLPNGKNGGVLTKPALPQNGGGFPAGPVDLERTSGAVVGALPAVPAGKVGELIVDDKKAGSTTTINLDATGYQYVYNESKANVVFDSGSGSPTVISTGAGSTTFFGAGGGGADVDEHGSNLFVAGGSGNYDVQFGNGTNTVWANAGNDAIQVGSGHNLIGLGAGSDTVFSGGSDTIIAGTGNATIIGASEDPSLIFGGSGPLVVTNPGATTVIAGGGPTTVFAGKSDVIYAANSPLLFVGGASGTSTVIGGSGNETLFGGGSGSKGLFFVGTGSFTLDVQAAKDTVVGGGGSSSVAIFGGAGSDLTLFSQSAGNQLVAGAGNETLNAAGSSGGNTFWAGSGNERLVGGSGADLFAFIKGSTGGSDTIGGWNGNDKLVLSGYGTGGETQKTVHGNAVITLSDGTKITVLGVASIPSSHIFLS